VKAWIWNETNKQSYGANLYFKLMLNKLKVMGSYLYLYPFGDLVQKRFHMPTIQKKIENPSQQYVNYKLIINKMSMINKLHARLQAD
jgi:hypothetical protein